jgi:prepilin-type N-terminal cleavage/methylation domain-containing protein
MEKAAGFTVIELLIVIAIISIIAAIAVPNLMSANIRAKVSGAKADMGSIAIALEDYKIDDPDRNYPVEPPTPYGHDEIAVSGRAFDDPSDALGLGELIFSEGASDPVYLHRIPGDPFNDGGEEEWNGESGAHNNHYCYFTADANQESNSTEAKYWALVSYGPDKDLDIANYSQAKKAVDSGTNLYDPDSGITSDGDIVIIGP